MINNKRARSFIWLSIFQNKHCYIYVVYDIIYRESVMSKRKISVFNFLVPLNFSGLDLWLTYYCRPTKFHENKLSKKKEKYCYYIFFILNTLNLLFIVYIFICLIKSLL